MIPAKIVFHLLHIVSAIIGAWMTYEFATATEGHPPGMVFTPVVVIIWAILHMSIGFFQKVASTGGKSAQHRTDIDGKWPPVLIFVALLFGGGVVLGLLSMIYLALFPGGNSKSSFPNILLIWLPPTICLIGILMRQAWSRILAAGIFILVGLFFLYRVARRLSHVNGLSTSDWVIMTTVIAILLFFGQHLLRSPKIKAFLST